MTDYRIVPVELLREARGALAHASARLEPGGALAHVNKSLSGLDAMLSAAPAVDRQAVVETIKLNPAFMAEVMDEQQDWLAGVLADAILALFGEGE
jgi:hypothetical protein